MKTALTIAGSDSSGGAGIQADLKTMIMNGVYGMSAITALTAQNTTGVRSIETVSSEFMGDQLDAVFEDIFPDAVKIGMLSSKEIITVIQEKLEQYNAKNVVLDPVMVSTSGAKLISEDAIQHLKEKLFPLAKLITPNIIEAEILSDMAINSDTDMELAGKKIFDEYNCAVLIKGGHSVNVANDCLYDTNGVHWYYGEVVDNNNTHGTGCTLSSAIASHLALGETLETAVEKGKAYITVLLKDGLELGAGSGPLNHGATLEKFK